jgi:hypothetical protein
LPLRYSLFLRFAEQRRADSRRPQIGSAIGPRGRVQRQHEELDWRCEPVEDIEQGKDRTAEHAGAYLKDAANSELPPLTWKNSHSS